MLGFNLRDIKSYQEGYNVNMRGHIKIKKKLAGGLRGLAWGGGAAAIARWAVIPRDIVDAECDLGPER